MRRMRTKVRQAAGFCFAMVMLDGYVFVSMHQLDFMLNGFECWQCIQIRAGSGSGAPLNCASVDSNAAAVLVAVTSGLVHRITALTSNAHIFPQRRPAMRRVAWTSCLD